MTKVLYTAAAIASLAVPALGGTLELPQTEAQVEIALPAADTWDRRYWGGALGFGQGTYTNGVSALNEIGVDIDVSGPMVSLRYGRSFQNGNAVWGYDADIGTGLSGVSPQGSSGPDWSCITGDCTVNINALATARGLYGFALAEDNLLYGAAGLAAAAVDGGIRNSSQEGSGIAFGYTAALGYERAINDRLSLFGEVAYYDLGPLPFGDGNGSNDFDAVGNFTAIRLGANFEF